MFGVAFSKQAEQTMSTEKPTPTSPYSRFIFVFIGLFIGLSALTALYFAFAVGITTPTIAQAAALQASQAKVAPPMGFDIDESYRGGQDDGPDLTTRQRVFESAERLRQQGLLPLTSTTPISFIWPIQLAPDRQDDYFSFWSVTQLTDNDLTYNSRLDYSCRDRTYDNSYYNHGGTDIVPWPFPWNQLEENGVQIISAADGVLIYKYDEDINDHNCLVTDTISISLGNYVVIEHPNGMTSWYAHMKHGSVTTKSVGSPVQAGEYLGIVGSSGFTTGPHVHFEVRNGDNIFAPNLDPFAGACNLLNPDSSSLWAQQPPYYDSAINKLTAGTQAPVFNTCSASEPNESDVVNAGQLIYYTAYHRDQLDTGVTHYTLFSPNGSPYHTWSWPPISPTIPYDPYDARSWPKYLFPNAPVGNWTFQAEYLGKTYQHTFEVLPPTGENRLYVSPDASGSMGGIAFDSSDILVYDLNTGVWSMYFDGSDVGIGVNVDAFAIYSSYYLAFSFERRTLLPGLVRYVEPEDMVLFHPTSLGENTAGHYLFSFDGSDVGLSGPNENIDAIAIHPNGKVVMSTSGAYNVPNEYGGSLTGGGEDVLIFNATSWYGDTSGNWSPYFDGTSQGLETTNENIDGVWHSRIDNEFFLSTSGPYDVPGLTGDDDDIFICAMGEDGLCSYTPFFEGAGFGIDALFLELALDMGGRR